jgi:hypothetical protein
VALQFVRVQPGLGQYVWRDYNEDGVEDLDEFEVAVFADSAAYIRTVLLTDDFVPTNTLNVNQSLSIDLSRLKANFWNRLSAQSTINLKRRALRSAGYPALFTLSVPKADTTIVGDNLSWRSALYFNRAKNAFRAELEHRQLSNRTISLQGLQVVRTVGQALKLRQPLGAAWVIGLESDVEQEQSESEGLQTRNFTIRSRELAPALTFQPGAYLRSTLEGKYREGLSDDLSSGVFARSISLELEIRLANAPNQLRRLEGLSVRGNLERVSQSFFGNRNSPLGFALLEGLQPGESWIWSLSTDQQIGRSLQLSLRYDGRQLGGGRVVHIGQAQVQAIF